MLERGAPHVSDNKERARLLCRAGDAYWNNDEPEAARRLLEEGVAGLESEGESVEAAGYRIQLGRCYWELLRSDLAREHFERARAVLEKEGPSEALAIAYLRISGSISFDRVTETGLEYARRAAEIAQHAGAAIAYAWSLLFATIAVFHLLQGQQAFANL